MNAMRKERIQVAKLLGILFGSVTAFYVCYFVWSVAIGDTAWYQLINRGTQVLVVAYITYAIHTEIRGRVRYTKHGDLYDAVDSKMAEDAVADSETVRIQNIASRGSDEHSPGDDPRAYEQLPNPGQMPYRYDERENTVHNDDDPPHYPNLSS